MNGGRFNFILHSKNQAHDLLSCCFNLPVCIHGNAVWSLEQHMTDRSTEHIVRESHSREIAHSARDLINMLIGEFL